MRPTIDEQLAGAQRLLDLVESTGDLPAESAELLRNAQRLIRRVATSWSTTLPFLIEDNARLTALLHQERGGDAAITDPMLAAARNNELRGSLARLIRELPGDAEGHARRVEIGQYLSRRVAADPT